MSTVIKHESKFCPRCNAGFECKVGDVVNCQCNTINLSSETQLFLDRTGFDCLCAACLLDFNQLQSKSSVFNFPRSRDEMIVGLHYYIENEYWVFTEFYHFLRGTCCQTGCRHCVYGFQNQIAKPND